MRVRQRKPRQERERLPAIGAAAAADANPVVMCVVCLLAAASMADDRIVLTNGALAQNDLGAAGRPIRFQLVRRNGKWDKQNRTLQELCPGIDLPRSEPEAEILPLKRKSQLEENNASRLQFFRSVIQRIGR